jgi:8-oxo-dGTP pyrophosphatase MutT (NUDIX family)
MAAIEPQKAPPTAVKTAKKRSQKVLLALPKGLVDPGEKPDQTAIREVREETGLIATPITKLTDIKYVYVRSWGDKERVFKIVSFYLLRYKAGTIDDITGEMRVEVGRAKWIPLQDGPKALQYTGEKQMARKALEFLNANPAT